MSASGTDEVSVEHEGAVMTLRLNAPGRLNAVSAPMLDTLCRQIEAAAFDPSVRAVVLTGSGRAFCAGADLGAGGALLDDGRTPDPAVVDAAHRLIVALTAVDKPVLCALNGLAAGLGVSLALACDIVVAHERAYFCWPSRRSD
jgi:enoyl-CoA hydratase/carnithine racemase